MSQLKFNKSSTSPDQAWTPVSQDNNLKYRLGTSPRLVGGTTFAKSVVIDQAQVQLLSQAAVTSMDETRKILMQWRRQGQCLADIYLYGIAECAKLIGELWSSDQLDFANCTVAHTHLHRAMHEFSPQFLSEGCAESNGRSLLIMNEPGSQHGLGVFMLSEFFRHAGWRVLLVAPEDIADFKRAFLSDWFDAVVLSISTDRHINTVAKAVSELRKATVNPNLKIYVGGPMAHTASDMLNWAGTSLLFTDAAQTVELVTQAALTASALASRTAPPNRSFLNIKELSQVTRM
ncbi:cobalamin B12-binding domain-containing protein [Limnohabitans sp.]|uniref:cobalamin B12-binding domain-containing protein n=1 Tax=Limnohabitans sp. TaxID=1907725 RepID=UPI003342551D